MCLEILPDGIAWFCGNHSAADQSGFLACPPAKRAPLLADLVAQQGWTGAPTTVVLPLDQYSVFQLERPDGLSDHDLADALRWKLKDLLDYSPSNAVCDVFDFPHDASRGRGHLVNVVSARKTLAKELVALVSDAGLELKRVDVAELALRNFAAQMDTSGRGMALVHLRDGYGQMVICKGPVLYLSRRLDVSAEDLRDAGRQESAVQSLALEMQRSLDYFESQLGQVPPRSVRLVARDTKLPLASMISNYVAAGIETVDWGAQGLTEPLDSRCLVAWSAALPVAEAPSR
ncbi:biogenesis protein MshI [Marinobacter caseinilyticus]|uniref:biogenesis protein MshI n=1 Tax=Marinobacter caseinilyticus TaxID=2692195 RepID=UPI001F3289FA|nr:biogenesis protein MshI [Marinobacter caseinilyticus]